MPSVIQLFSPSPRARGRAAVGLALAAALTLLAPRADAAVKAFASGSYIIPMDETHQNSGMFKAYGLVYRLLGQGVKVSWAIRPSKGYPPPGGPGGPFSGPNPIDFSATTVDQRTAAAIGSPYSYAGGPFIIDSADAAVALPIITAWWTANANLPNVHRATAGFSADIDIVLNHAPRIAVEETNSGIAINYFKAASIPDDNGAAWTSSSPNIFDEAKIAGGGLLDQAAGCGKRKWDVFVTPHNGGYSYSLTDPTNLGTRTYSELDKFVFYGGGWIALCHSILSNEDNIASLYQNSSPSVRALFLSSQNTGFLTQNGFGSNIVNKGGTYVLDRADLPIGQAVTTSGATQALPGGSVQTWQSVPGGFPTGVQYLNGVERVAWFDNTTLNKQYDHVVNGVYHGGDGRGKLSFIGGHSYSTTLPYSSNYEAPYVRFFLNALFFNGAAVARLALYTPTTSVSVGVPSTFPVHIKNLGASTATNILTTTVTLAAGVSYTGFVSGTPPSCDPTGLVPSGCASGVLSWPTLPNMAGDASGVVFNVSRTYPATTTDPINPPNVGVMTTNYGDTLGETFKGGDCLSVSVTPAPVPAITKTRVADDLTTPGDPGDLYTAGNLVYWKLDYANTGGVSLLNAVVEDVLPLGFAVDATLTSPAPASVVPQVDGTHIKWNLGTLAAGASGSIILATAAPSIAMPSQTFTNSVTLTGYDASGTSFTTAPATAMATVVKPNVDIGKAVDKASANPGEVLTYTITPAYAGTLRLNNVVVTDPIPANTTYVASSANAGGFLDTTTTPNQVTWGLGSNAPPVIGTAPPIGFALCPATATFDTTTGIIDTYIGKANPTDNFGTENRLLTRPADANRLKYTLVRFNLGATIPAGAIIQSAYFKLTVQTNRNNHFDSVRKVTTSWTEAGATWNLRDGASPWAGGGAFSSADYGTTPYGTFVPRAKVELFVDVAGAVSDWVNGETNNGLVLISTGTDGGDAKYYSDEEGTASRRPVLVVTYLQKIGPIPPATTCSGAPTTLTAIADTYLDKDDVDKNDGAANTLNVNAGTNNTTSKTNHSLIRFDLSAVPPGATITSAFLKVNVATNKANEVDEIHRMNTAWNETGATWNRRNGVASWAAGSFSSADYGPTVYNTITPSVNGTTSPCGPEGQFCRDVTSLVDDWVNNGFANNGLVLLATGTNNADAKYSSREDGTPDRRPQLIVTWTQPANTGAATTTSLTVEPLLRTGTGNVTVTMTVSSPDNIGTVTPPALLAVTPGNSTVTYVSGPSPASAPVNNSSAAFTWVYQVVPGTLPDDTLYFAGKPTSSVVGTKFGIAQSPSVITTPPLTFQVTIANPLVPATTQQITNTAALNSDEASDSSAPAITTILRPQLSITKSRSPAGALLPGQNVVYTITVRNDGLGNATGVGITDTMAANLTFVSCSPACTTNPSVGATGTVTWNATNVGTILPGGVIIRTFTAKASTTLAASCTPATLANTASTTGTVLTSNTVTNTLNLTPNMQIVKSSNIVTDVVLANTNIVYTLSVKNNGGGNVSNLVVTDVISDGTTFVSCSGACTNPGVGNPGTVTWTIAGPLAGGATAAALTLTVNVPVGQVDGSTITNGASLVVNSLACGTAQSNVVSHTVSAPPLLAISKTSNPVTTTNVTPGQIITYTVTVTNNGPGYTTDAVINDPIPTNTAYVPGSTRFIARDSSSCVVEETPGSVPIEGSLPVYSPPATCHPPGGLGGTDGGTLYTTPPIAPIPAPTTATFTFQVKVNDPIDTNTSITNTAYVAVGSPTGACTASPATNPTVPPYCIFSNTPVHQVPTPTIALKVNKSAVSVYPLYDLTTWPNCEQRPDALGGFSSVNCAYYTVTVTNDGPNAASNFSVLETLPAGLSINPLVPSQGFTASQGSVSGPVSGTYTWQVSGNYDPLVGAASPPGLAVGASATLLVAARLCDAYGLSGPADTSCLASDSMGLPPSAGGLVNNVSLTNSLDQMNDTYLAAPGSCAPAASCRASSAQVFVLGYTPATLRGLQADPASGRIRFATGTQTRTRGFQIWASDEKKKKPGLRLTRDLIPALVPTSMSPIIYEAQVPSFTERFIFIEEIDLSGRSRMMGPLAVDDARLQRTLSVTEARLAAGRGISRQDSPGGTHAKMAKKPEKPKGKTRKSEARDAQVKAAGATAPENTKAAKILTVGRGVATVPRSLLAAAGLPAKTPLSKINLTAFGYDIPTTIVGAGTANEALQFVASDIDTVYSGRAAYIASWGLKVKEPLVDLTLPEPPPPEGYVRAQQHSYFIGIAPLEIDPWVWDAIPGDGSTWPQPWADPSSGLFDLPGLEPQGTDPAAVRVSLWVIDPGPYQIEASINGVPIGSKSGTGEQQVVVTGELPLTSLRAAGNTLTVRYNGSPSPAVLATLRHVEVKAPFNSRTATATVDAVISYDPDLPSTKDTDYLILTHTLFADAATRLARLKAAEGYKPVVVDTESVYDAYSGGVFDAAALQRYIADVYKNKRLSYVVLVGDDTFDPQDFFDSGDAAFVPSIFGWDGQQGRVATENRYADVNGDGKPDIAIGRLSAATAEEAAVMVAKVERQASVLRASHGRNLFVADNSSPTDPDFNSTAASVAQIFPATAWSRVSDGIDPARKALVAGWRKGVALVHYFGHGGPGTWADEEVLTADDALGLQTPEAVVLQRACQTQMYQYYYSPSLGESLMLNPRGGALASFGPSGITNTRVQATLFDHLYDEMKAAPGVPLGEMIRRAKTKAVDDGAESQFGVEGFNLLGDPAIRLDGVSAAVKVR